MDIEPRTAAFVSQHHIFMGIDCESTDVVSWPAIWRHLVIGQACISVVHYRWIIKFTCAQLILIECSFLVVLGPDRMAELVEGHRSIPWSSQTNDLTIYTCHSLPSLALSIIRIGQGAVE